MIWRSHELALAFHGSAARNKMGQRPHGQRAGSRGSCGYRGNRLDVVAKEERRTGSPPPLVGPGVRVSRSSAPGAAEAERSEYA